LNSKLLLFCIFLTSCGLKKYPKAPEGSKLPDISNSYKFKYQDKNEKKKKKNKDQKVQSEQTSQPKNQ